MRKCRIVPAALIAGSVIAGPLSEVVAELGAIVSLGVPATVVL